MDQVVKALWVTALRSGDYKQGQGVLRSKLTETSTASRFCCLGVLCELAVKANVIPEAEYDGFYYNYGVTEDKHSAYPPRVVMNWAGLRNENPRYGTDTLAAMNDNGKTFEQIADAIEENL